MTEKKNIFKIVTYENLNDLTLNENKNIDFK